VPTAKDSRCRVWPRGPCRCVARVAWPVSRGPCRCVARVAWPVSRGPCRVARVAWPCRVARVAWPVSRGPCRVPVSRGPCRVARVDAWPAVQAVSGRPAVSGDARWTVGVSALCTCRIAVGSWLDFGVELAPDAHE